MTWLPTPRFAILAEGPGFTLRDPMGGAYSLDGLMGRNGLLVAFICNHCPYVVAVIDGLVDDAAALKEDGINTVGIMANDYATYTDDSPDKMLTFAARYGFGFPYLVDETQEVARAFGAVCTPDFRAERRGRAAISWPHR